MKKTALFAIVFILYIQPAVSQSNEFFPDYFPVSPQAASFGKYLDLPVDLSTGRINHQIPLCVINEDDFSVPIFLSYNYSGLLVDEKPTTTGLGWSLMAGGLITRKINGKPDEQGYLSTGSGQWVADLAEGNLSVTDTNTLITQVGMGLMDAEPDKFILMAKGLSATFYINHAGEVVFFPDSDLKVEYDSNNLLNFTVTDTMGNIYVFSAQDNVNTISTIGSTVNEDDYVSTWALTQIIPYLSKRTINFEYEINTVTQNSTSKKIDKLLNYPNPYDRCNQKNNNITDVNHTIIFEDLIINKIYTHNQSINFHYNFIDNLRGKVLSQIIATNQPSYLFTFQPNSNNQILQKIEKSEISNSQVEPYYQFEYELGNYKPSTNNRDYLGYYNSTNNGIINNNGGIEKDVSFNSTKTGALKKIIYPTGGYTEITYEQNQINRSTLLNNDFNENIDCIEKSISINKGIYRNTSGGFDTKTYEKTYTPPPGYSIKAGLDNYECDDVRASFSFTSNVAGILGIFRVYGDNVLIGTRHTSLELFPPDQSVITQNADFQLPNNLNGVPFKNFRIELLLELPPAFANIRYPFISGYGVLHFGLEPDSSDPVISNIEYPGIRLKEIKTCESMNSICTKKRFIYEMSDGNSSGMAFSQPNFWSHSFRKFHMNSSPLGMSSYDCYFKSINSNSQTPISSYSGSPVLYKQVKEEILSDTNIKLAELVHNYSGQVFPPPILPYIQVPNFEWENGKELLKRVYSDKQVLKSKDSINYERLFSFKNQPNVYAFKSIQIEFSESGVVSTNAFDYSLRTFVRGIYKQKKSSLFSYLGNNNISTESNYFYDNPNHLQPTRVVTTNSKGEALKQEISYAHERNDTRLINENRIAVPLKQITYKDTTKLSEQSTTYDDFNGLYLPKSIQNLKGESSSTNTLEDRITYHDYDAYGNPLEVSKADGTHIVYIWGYNHTQPIAKIENVTYADVQSQVATLQALSNADTDRTIDTINQDGSITKVGKEGDLREALQNLRTNLPNALVSTYTYDPLIGVTSITDPRGDTVYYEYDDFNRLKHVKDKDGNILSENEYNYKN